MEQFCFLVLSANVLAGILCRISFVISQLSFAVNVIRGARRVTRAGMRYIWKREKCTHKSNIEARSYNRCCSGKAM